MRKGRSPDFLESNGKIVGINLSSDCVAEHEWGIRPLQRKFGVEESEFGFKYVVCHTFPELLVHELTLKRGNGKQEQALLVVCKDNVHITKQIIEESGTPGYKVADWFDLCVLHSDKNLFTAWDSYSFAILARGDAIPKLREFLKAFKDKDLTIMLTGQKEYENENFTLVRASSFTEKEKQIFLELDSDRINLSRASAAINIRAELAAAKKEYLTLKPRWLIDISHIKSEYPVVYWLNPKNPTDNSGWFSVEDLRLWIQNKGPIPKK